MQDSDGIVEAFPSHDCPLISVHQQRGKGLGKRKTKHQAIQTGGCKGTQSMGYEAVNKGLWHILLAFVFVNSLQARMALSVAQIISQYAWLNYWIVCMVAYRGDDRNEVNKKMVILCIVKVVFVAVIENTFLWVLTTKRAVWCNYYAVVLTLERVAMYLTSPLNEEQIFLYLFCFW